MKKRTLQAVEEGSWFAVPLPTGFAVGLAARISEPVMLAYFFGPVRQHVPALGDLRGLEPSSAVRVLRVSTMAIRDTQWPTIGRHPDWQREKWPIPDFIRREPPALSKRAWVVRYSDDDPSLVISETPASEANGGLESDGLYGTAAAEKVIAAALVI